MTFQDTRGTETPLLPIKESTVKPTNSSRCEIGKWGASCEYKCNGTCAEQSCDRITGHCESCPGNNWGNFCEKSCEIDHCIQQSVCDRATGPVCAVCAFKKWGPLCENGCPVNCVGSCLQSGSCKACRDGFLGSTCNATCSTHCLSCDQETGVCDTCISGIEQFWGDKCEFSCRIPNCAGPLLCTKDDGPTCFRCKTGSWGPACENTCNERCHGECSMTNGECLVFEEKSQRMRSSKSTGKTSHHPPFATIKIVQSGDVSRDEIFGIAFGTSILVSLIMATLYLMAYKMYYKRYATGPGHEKINNMVSEQARHITSCTSTEDG